MKKNLSVTLGGRSFTIDEDAYFALDAYIEGIRSHYAPEDPDGEIVSDFESRIADLFADEIRQQGPGATITIDAVRRTIERVGSLDRLFDDEEEQQSVEEELLADDEPAQSDTSAPETETEQRRTPTPPIPPIGMEGPRPRHIYYRSTVDRWLGGVLGGIGEYLGMDALLFRLTFILLLFTPVAPAIILVYLAMALFVPRARTVTQRLELHGKPVSPSTIWQNIDETITKSEAEGKEPGERRSTFPRPSDFLSPAWRKGLLWAGVILMVIAICVAMVGVIAGLADGDLFQYDFFHDGQYFINTAAGILFTIAMSFAALPIAALLIYVIGVIPIGMILRSKHSSTTVKAVSIALWVIILLALWHIIF
ncbi:PspC domain-containing protein [uncultured Porphyromonas sp.]|uniref:PspC domain-containing protein n=1 Tax=uncultured Porphyromonas sp. TaxID=159274 RepID=UPI0025CED87D|nr:PspC domain-containing protein [uncultured Porphyromonas sp.]